MPSTATAPPVSPFLRIPDAIPPSSEAPSIVHLKRDLLQAITVGHPSSEQVLATRFGDFPHASLVGLPYGSQVRAATVKPPKNRKRKRTADDSSDGPAKDAASGFMHVLAPTAELWTTSLPHRTQVVYTPDSSYILQRLGVKPGSVFIEAGAGSGSFTHAAVRAVYSGYPDGRDGEVQNGLRRGKVWSYEFHEERVGKLREEIRRHELDGLVEITHRDVCKDGFLVSPKKEDGSEDDATEEKVSPGATAIFLDLPAPWLALPHLSRRPRASNPPLTSDAATPTTAALSADPTANITVSMPLQSFLDPSSSSSTAPHVSIDDSTLDDPASLEASTPTATTNSTPLLSPLSPTDTVRICTFSPCIEQVTRTTDALRKLGWVDIDMIEIAHSRLEVRRQTSKGYDEGAGPRTIAEALTRLKANSDYREQRKGEQIAAAAATKNRTLVPKEEEGEGDGEGEEEAEPRPQRRSGGGRRKKIVDPDEGRLITRLEPEVKSHTSYLTFATLPREWTDDDEREAATMAKCISKGPTAPPPTEADRKPWLKKEGEGEAPQPEKPLSKRQMKKAVKVEREKAEAERRAAGGEAGEAAKASDTVDAVDAMDVDVDVYA